MPELRVSPSGDDESPDGLDPNARLTLVGGHTHAEAAAMLDLPLGTARTRIRDGLIRLCDTLGLTS